MKEGRRDEEEEEEEEEEEGGEVYRQQQRVCMCFVKSGKTATAMKKKKGVAAIEISSLVA